MNSHAIEFENVTIQQGQQILFQDMNLSFASGQVWGILGPNGVGKTTLLYQIMRLLPVSTGKIIFHGIDTSHRTQFARHVGILFQDLQTTFAQTVLDYCETAFFPHLDHFQQISTQQTKRIQHYLTLLQLDHLRWKPLNKLSGGEKRRVAIAALLIQQPRVYLLDEPTNHLDLAHQIQIFSHFRQLARQQSLVIMTLHDLNQAQQFCDHILLLYPNGSYIAGETASVLTIDHLSQLYQQPLLRHEFEKGVFWHTPTEL